MRMSDAYGVMMLGVENPKGRRKRKQGLRRKPPRKLVRCIRESLYSLFREGLMCVCVQMKNTIHTTDNIPRGRNGTSTHMVTSSSVDEHFMVLKEHQNAKKEL